MKTVRSCIQFILLLLAMLVPLGLVWSVVNPADYRLIPRYVNGVISLLAVPFQVVFAVLRVDNIHNIGIPAKTLGAVSVELIIVGCLRLLRRRKENANSKLGRALNRIRLEGGK